MSPARRSRLTLLLAVMAACARPAQPPPPLPGPGPCHDDAAREFDFWLGDWRVVQEIRTAEGGWESYPARSTVSRGLDGCALLERWRGTVRFFWEGMTEPEPMDGLSVRARGPDGAWRIHWMDTRNPSFGEPFVGGFRDGVGTFVRTTTNPDGSTAVARIRFFDINQASVEWELSIAGEGEAWTPIWRMHFARDGA